MALPSPPLSYSLARDPDQPQLAPTLARISEMQLRARRRYTRRVASTRDAYVIAVDRQAEPVTITTPALTNVINSRRAGKYDRRGI